MVFRTVAAETPSRKFLAIVREPAGSAVVTYDWITASSTWRSRSESLCVVIIQVM